MLSKLKIGIVGATGLIGSKLLEIMQERKIKPDELRLFASEKSAGKGIRFSSKIYRVRKLTRKDVRGLDIVFFAAGSMVSSQWARIFAESGAIVIDKSSAWRKDRDCPLVIPRVNPQALDNIPKGIISSPNCSTIGLLIPLKPVIDSLGFPQRIIVSTYQSVSGAGMGAMKALKRQRLGAIADGPFKEQIAQNLIPGIGMFDERGNCTEELKLVNESRRILERPNLDIIATAVRVPVDISHSESVNLLYNSPFDIDKVLDAISNSKWIDLMNNYDLPTPLKAANNDRVLVGRVRQSGLDRKILSFFTVSDNLRIGAATNAIEIAELVADKINKAREEN